MTTKTRELIKTIEENFGVNLFDKTRLRGVIEARALFIHILRDYHKMRLIDIQRVFAERGYSIHHATLLHAEKNFNDYLRFSPELRELTEMVLNSYDKKTSFKIQYIKNSLNDITEDKLNEMYEYIKEAKI
jgi:chromosomal replication initiation ATPase DnaA